MTGVQTCALPISAVTEDIIAVPNTAKTVMAVLEASSPEDAKRVAFWLMQPQTEDNTESVDAVVDVSVARLIKL